MKNLLNSRITHMETKKGEDKEEDDWKQNIGKKQKQEKWWKGKTIFMMKNSEEFRRKTIEVWARERKR